MTNPSRRGRRVEGGEEGRRSLGCLRGTEILSETRRSFQDALWVGIPSSARALGQGLRGRLN